MWHAFVRLARQHERQRTRRAAATCSEGSKICCRSCEVRSFRRTCCHQNWSLIGVFQLRIAIKIFKLLQAEHLWKTEFFLPVDLGYMNSESQTVVIRKKNVAKWKILKGCQRKVVFAIFCLYHIRAQRFIQTRPSLVMRRLIRLCGLQDLLELWSDFGRPQVLKVAVNIPKFVMFVQNKSGFKLNHFP